MPDYAPIYNQGLRAYDPATGQEVTGVLDPQKKYNLEFFSEPATNVSPQQMQDLTSQMVQEPAWQQETNINDVPEQDYNLARLTIKRQYTDDMKIANQYMPQPGMPPSMEYITLAQEAAATFQARNAELNSNNQKVKNQFQQVDKDPNSNPAEKEQFKIGYYQKNPVWKAPKVEYPQFVSNASRSSSTGTGTASATERTAIAEARASMDTLSNLKQLYATGSFGRYAPITGRLAPTSGLLGGTTQSQEDFMAATSAFKNAIIKQITGAQMSEQEANRIMKQIPDITDPPFRWRAKWNQSMLNIKTIEKRRLEILKQSGIKTPENPGAEELRLQGTPQAYQQGVELGYWQ